MDPSGQAWGGQGWGGINTVSITWITPLVATISVMTTLALSIMTVPLLTVIRTIAPFTVFASDIFTTSAAITVPVGDALAPELKKLLEVTEASLYKGIEQAKIAQKAKDFSAKFPTITVSKTT